MQNTQSCSCAVSSLLRLFATRLLAASLAGAFAIPAVLFAAPNSNPEQNQQPLAVYATLMAHPNTNTAFIEATHEALSKAFAPRKVTFEMLPIAELDKIVNVRKAGVVMAGAGFYRRHLHEGLRDIATVVSPLQPNADRADGSTIVVLKNRDDIKSLADLKGKTISANASIGCQGILIVKNELAKAGFNPDKFFKNEVYVGMDLLPSIGLLRSGKIDAAILTSCLIEESLARGMHWPEELLTRLQNSRLSAIIRA